MSVMLRIMGKFPDGSPDDNQRTWVAADPLLTNSEHSAIVQEQRGLNRKTNEASGNGWAFTEASDTKNETLTLSFSTTRTFSSTVAAWRWCNLFSRLNPSDWPHPIKGDCIMRYQIEDGTWEEERLYKCLLGKPTMNRTGKTVELRYTLRGGRIEAYAAGEDAIPMSDGIAYDAPQAGLFLTSVGGTPMLDIASTWSSSLEANNGWWLHIGAADVRSTPSGIDQNFYFGVAGAGVSNGLPPPVIDMLPPMKDRLAAIGAALDPTWFSYTLETNGGRQMLRIKNIRSSDYVGSAFPPVLDVTVSTFWPQVPGNTVYKHSAGELVLFNDVIPFDDSGDIPVADDDVG